MSVWPFHTSEYSSISLMLRDNTLYYAHHTKKDGLKTGHCAWPHGFAESNLPNLIASKSHVQYVIPPEHVRIIQIDKPEGMQGKTLLNYARMELLNYIDTPLEETVVTLLKTPSLDNQHLITQIVFAASIKEHMDQFEEKGIAINRLSLPDGGFVSCKNHTDEQSRHVIVVLDPFAPRILSHDQGQLDGIQPLPKPNIPIKQGVCPTLSSSIEQWLQRYFAKQGDSPVLFVTESDEATERWQTHFKEKFSSEETSFSSYPKNFDTSSFCELWVALAAQHDHSKHYLPFDLCWTKPQHTLKRCILWPCYAVLAATLAFVGVKSSSQWLHINELQHKITSITTNNKLFDTTLGNKKDAVLGSFSPLMNQENTTILSTLRLLGSRAFPGLWIDTFSIEKHRLELVGSVSKLPLFRQYIDWLKKSSLVKEINLKKLAPQDLHKTELKNAIASVDESIKASERFILRNDGIVVKQKQKTLKGLHQQRNRLLLSDKKSKAERFDFTLILTLR